MNSDVWDPDIARQISSALAERDLVEVERLLVDNPGHLLHNGDDFWLSGVAGEGWLDGVKALVAAGVDVNASANIGRGTPFWQPEGAILVAVANGCADVVEWLLAHGAQINFEVEGKRRCLPLISAIRSGRDDIASMLVEHGADINAVWVDGNATTIAEYSGRFDLRDYFLRNGGVDLRDVTPADYHASHTLVEEYFAERCVNGGVLSCTVGGTVPSVSVMLAASGTCQTLYTNGLSDRVLAYGRRKYACSELTVALPGDVTPGSSVFKWAEGELIRLIRILVAQDAWFGQTVVIANSAAPQCPFDYWLVHPVADIVSPDYRIISINELLPLFAEEAEVVFHCGIDDEIERRIEELRPQMLRKDREMLC